jgi:hypothetical protein
MRFLNPRARIRERDEVIVVHPDQIVRLNHRRHAGGETLVDPLIAEAEVALVLSQVDPVMEQRPQRRIGITVIVFLDVLRREVDGRHGDAAELTDLRLIARIVYFLARPAEPQAAGLFQRRRKRARQPALRARLAARVGHRDPVRYDDEARHGFQSRFSGLCSSSARAARRS